ncbi:hypothetical protein LTR10_002575 [Elasticomyces elasticus]|nr:hypothetical protein LTR10_002575 [Elasticomyces elasticus]KAK4973368.1 hypothetical protein LTR42_005353 [Elasticomyces elasticus]
MAAVNLEEIKKKYNFKQISVATWRNPNGSILPARGGPKSPLVSAEAAGTPFIPSYKVSYRLPEPTDDEASEDEEDAKSEKEGPVDSPLEATAPADPAGDHHDTPSPHDAEDPNEIVEIIDESIDAIKDGDMGGEPSENVQETAQPPEAVPPPPEPVEVLSPEIDTIADVPGDAVQDSSDLGGEMMEHTLDMPGSFDMLPPAAPSPPSMAPLGDVRDASTDMPPRLSLDMPDDLPEATSTDKTVHFAPGTPEPKPTSRKKKSSKGTKSKKRISVPIDSLPDDIVAIVDETIGSVSIPVLEERNDLVDVQPSTEPGEPVQVLGEESAPDGGEVVAAEQAAAIVHVIPEPLIEETSVIEPGPDVSGIVVEVLPTEHIEPSMAEVSKPKKKSSKSSGKDKDKSKKKLKVKDMIQTFEGLGTDMLPPPALPDLVIDVSPPPPPAVEAETVQESVEESEGQESLTLPADVATLEPASPPIVAHADVEDDAGSDGPIREHEPVKEDEQHATPEVAITSDIDASALPIVEAAPEEVGIHEEDPEEGSVEPTAQDIDVDIVPDESDTLESSEKVTDDRVADDEGSINHDDGQSVSNDEPVDDELQDSATAHDPDAAETADIPPPDPDSVDSTPTDESTAIQDIDPSPAEAVSIEDDSTGADETAVVNEESNSGLDESEIGQETLVAESAPEEPAIEETSADKVEEPAVVEVSIDNGPTADADESHAEDDAAKHPEIETTVIEDVVIEEIVVEEAVVEDVVVEDVVVEAPKDESTELMEAVSEPVLDEAAIESSPIVEEPTEAPAESPGEDTGTAEQNGADLPSDIAEAEASPEATEASHPEPATERSVEPPTDANDETLAVEIPPAAKSMPAEQPAEPTMTADAPAVQEDTPSTRPPAPPSPTLSKGGSHKHKADRWERKHELKRTSTDIKPDKPSASKRSSRHSKEEPRSADRPHRSRRHTMPAENEAERTKRREARKAEELARTMEEERRKADEEELRQIRHEARRAARKAAAEEAAKIAREEAEAVAREEAERRRKRREARDRKEEAARPPPRPRRESVTKAPLFIRTSGDQPRERKREETSHRSSRHSERPSLKRGSSPTSKSSKDAGQSNDASSTPTEPVSSSSTGSKSHRSHREAEDGERPRSSRRDSERHSRRPVVEEKPRSFFGSLLRRL